MTAAAPASADDNTTTPAVGKVYFTDKPPAGAVMLTPSDPVGVIGQIVGALLQLGSGLTGAGLETAMCGAGSIPGGETQCVSGVWAGYSAISNFIVNVQTAVVGAIGGLPGSGGGIACIPLGVTSYCF